MAQYGKIGFEFDHWAELAKKDPEAFERKRSAAIHACISDAPEASQKRLKGLQWQVDSVRRTSSNPMAACLKISNMMWKSVLDEDGLLDNMQRLKLSETRRQPEKQKANLLQFERPARDYDD